MSEASNSEFDLDQLSVAETDEEFGLPEFRDHFADTLTPAVLKDWTAKDFASIYVRFRPHLVHYAKRFLTNSTQAEDVVQDAFLYLMTSLPELDSELGVLKFLKWKVRLLAIDMIRASRKASMSSLEENHDLTTQNDAVGEALERTEDSAVVSLALAKLQPRQRAALILTIYEGMPQPEAAEKLGLNENAFRQLLLRSRRAFKVALVGEAETAGLTVPQILSVAAKKASALKVGAIASVLFVGVSIFPGLAEVPPLNSVVSQAAVTPESRLNLLEWREPRVSLEVDELPPAQGKSTIAQFAVNTELTGPTQTEAKANSLITQTNADNQAAEVDGAKEMQDEVEISRQLLQSALGTDIVASFTAQLDASPASHSLVDERTVLVEYPAMKATIILGALTEEPVQFVYLTFMTAGAELTAVPKTAVSAFKTDSESGSYLELGMTDLIIGDTSGHFDMVTVADSALSRAYLKLRVKFDVSGEIEFSSLQIINPTGKSS